MYCGGLNAVDDISRRARGSATLAGFCYIQIGRLQRVSHARAVGEARVQSFGCIGATCSEERIAGIFV